MAIASATLINQYRTTDLQAISWLVRSATCSEEDQQFLTSMCYVSVFPMRHCRISNYDVGVVARLPQIFPWRNAWGRPGDIALLAVDANTRRRLGAIWCRLFPSAHDFVPGFYACDVPIAALAVDTDARRLGIGQALLQELKQSAYQQGHTTLSLGVSTMSAAKLLYERHGFIAHHVQSHPGLITMFTDLTVR